MPFLYQAIGRLVIAFVRVRFRKQLRIAAAIAVLGVLGAGWAVASRDVEEG